MSGPSDDWFAPPSGPPAPPPTAPRPPVPSPPPGYHAGPAGPPPPGHATGPATTGQAGPGWYPQEAYYAPGWAAPLTPDPQRRRRLGRRFWWPVAGVATVGLVVAAVLGTRFWLDRRPLGTVDAATTVAATRLATGHCLPVLPADGAVARVTVVPCGAPHAAEVIGTMVLPAGAWPGQQSIDDSLARWCEMDSTEKAAGFHSVVWAPSQRGWGQGDRTGLCFAALPDGTATGSFSAGQPVTTTRAGGSAG